MFRHKSWIRRAGIAVALLVSLCAGSVALPHAEGLDDVTCNVVPVLHDESEHYIGADPTPSQVDADHCFLCHSARSFHTGFEKFEQHGDTLQAVRLPASLVDFSSLAEWTLVHGRAPPA